jgi:hypothetical protein
LKRTASYRRATVLEASRLLILIVFSPLSPLSEAQVTFGRNVQQDVHVSSEAGMAAATLSVTQVQTVLPAGRVADGSIIAIFVPSSRLFWWMHQGSDGVTDPETALKEFLDRFTFSVHPDQIACFSADGRNLWFRSSDVRVSNMDQGLSKLRKLLPEELPGMLPGGTVQFQRVPLAQAVGQTFLSPKDFGGPPVRLKVGAVDRSASGWRIEIRNDRGESKTVTLTRDFKVETSASQ